MKYIWEDLVESSDFDHGQEFVTVEDYEEIESEKVSLEKAYNLINEDMKAKVTENKELRKRLADGTSKYSQLANSHTRLKNALEDIKDHGFLDSCHEIARKALGME